MTTGNPGRAVEVSVRIAEEARQAERYRAIVGDTPVDKHVRCLDFMIRRLIVGNRPLDETEKQEYRDRVKVAFTYLRPKEQAVLYLCWGLINGIEMPSTIAATRLDLGGGTVAAIRRTAEKKIGRLVTRMGEEPKPVDPNRITDDSPIEALEFSVRTYNCLKKHVDYSVGELCKCTANDLFFTRGFGQTNLAEVREKLASIGRHLKGEEMSPEEILDYVAQLGRDITNYAHKAKAMVAKAREEGIETLIESNASLNKFLPTFDGEVQLIRSRSDVMAIITALYEAGVLVTEEEMA